MYRGNRNCTAVEFTRQYQLVLLEKVMQGKAYGKSKFRPRRSREGPEGEYMYSSTLSLISTLDMVGVLNASPRSLYSRERPKVRSGRVRKISPTPGFHPRTVQPVASRYIDCAVPAQWGIKTGANGIIVVEL
jgi:hypothetical protein